MFANAVVVLLHGLIVAEDGLADLLLEIREETLDNSQHLSLGFLDALSHCLLFLSPNCLLLPNLFTAVGKFLYSRLEKGVDVTSGLDDAE